ncbi:MAG: putative nucleotide-diphospho-sugar transferase [Pirellulales bacterium]|nr:putative nucleotide-diphospho-sugar transferase [Pirellulales bacterium]
MANIKRLAVVSFCDHIRTTSIINHAVYSSMQSIPYHFDIAPTVNRGYFAKIEVIIKFLSLYDWIFWIDDDAYFTQLDVPLTDFIKEQSEQDFVFCKSPVNQGEWTYLSSGNFFARNSPRTHDVLNAILRTDLQTVENWWDRDSFGLFTNGDQDALVYQLLAGDHGATYTRLPFHVFNTRSFHFERSAREHFLVHFTGNDKHLQSAAFARRLGLSTALLPADLDHGITSKFVDEMMPCSTRNPYVPRKLKSVTQRLLRMGR